MMRSLGWLLWVSSVTVGVVNGLNSCLDSVSVNYKCEAGSRDLILEDCNLVDEDIQDIADCLDTVGRSTLGYLKLDNNNITALPEGIFEDLVQLRKLDLDSNRIRQIPVELLSDCINLRYLSISRNELTTLPETLFANNGKLENLRIRSNRDLVTDFPRGVYARTLKELPGGLFAGLSNLRSLDLFRNAISELPVELFVGLDKLEYLNLRMNDLANLPLGLFTDLGALQRLSLKSNELVELPPGGVFEGLASLDYLDLSFNDMTTMPEDCFTGLGNLRALVVRDNELTSLPASIFAPLEVLEILYLSGNNLECVPPTVATNVEGPTFCE